MGRLLTHHTKTKGDEGLGYVLSRLLSSGIQVALPVGEFLPFDLIAISIHGDLRRVSVKYRSSDNGIIEVDLRSQWSNSKQAFHKNFDPSLVDVIAVFCPDTKTSYFVLTKELKPGANSVQLRLTPPKIQVPNVRLASGYEDPARMFG